MDKKSQINLYDKSMKEQSVDDGNIGKLSNIQYVRNKHWWRGFRTHVFGAVLFANTLGLSVLVVNLSMEILNETLNKPQIFGTILIIMDADLL